MHHQHVVIQEALSQAVRQEIIPRDPAILVDPPAMARTEIHSLTESQARQLVAGLEGDRLWALYVLALATGMRQGELLALRWQDVALAGRVLSVRRSVRYVNGRGFVFDEPKTRSGRRSIGLSVDLCEVLRRHEAAQAVEKARLGVAWAHPELVFTLRIGTPLQGDWLLRRLHTSLRQVGLPRVRFHDLRHTAAMIMLGHNVNPKVVSEMLGHSDIAITLGLYGHVTPPMQQEAADTMDQLFQDKE